MLLYRPAATGKRQEQTTPIKFTATTLIQKDGNGPGKDLEMQRVQSGKSGSPPIVGVWSYPHYTGMTAFITFTRDGRMLFRLPMRSDPGTWAVSGSSLTFTTPGEAGRTYAYEIRDDILTMSGNGQQFKYKRVTPFD